MIEVVLFWLFTGLMLASALSVVLSHRPIYSVLSLLAAMFSLACLFVMLGAFFVAALQILLYAGAVLVLFLFVIMLLNLSPEALARARLFTLQTAGTAAAALLLLQLFGLVIRLGPQPALSGLPQASGTVETIGRLLFSAYLLPFELVSFIVLAAIIGAVTLAKHEGRE